MNSYLQTNPQISITKKLNVESAYSIVLKKILFLFVYTRTVPCNVKMLTAQILSNTIY